MGSECISTALNFGFVYCTTLVLLQFWARLLSEPLCRNTACIFFEPNSLDLQSAQSIAKKNKTQNKQHFGERGHAITSLPRAKFNSLSTPGYLLWAVCGMSRKQGLWEGTAGQVGKVCPQVQSSCLSDGASSPSKGTTLTQNGVLSTDSNYS